MGGWDEEEEFPDPNIPSPPWLPGSTSSTTPSSQVWVGAAGLREHFRWSWVRLVPPCSHPAH